MLKRKHEIEYIRYQFSLWAAKIMIDNNSGFTDENKCSEGLCMQLLNIIYELRLEKLELNFPYIDLAESNKIAYQITSRFDADKIRTNLKGFYDDGYDKQYIQGLFFLILNCDKKVKFGKNPPSKTYPKFNESKQIKNFSDLINEIEKLYDNNYSSFQKIKDLLTREVDHFSQNKEIYVENDIPELHFSFENETFIKYKQEELSIVLQDINRRREQNLLPLFNITIKEEHRFLNEIEDLKKVSNDLSSRKKISDLKDILFHFAKIKNEISFKTEVFLVLKKNEGFDFTDFDLPSYSLLIMYDDLWGVKILREKTLIDEFLNISIKLRKVYRVNRKEIKLDIIGKNIVFPIYIELEKVKEIFPKEFDINNTTMLMVSTIWDVRVYSLDFEIIISKVIPAFLDRVYNETVKVEDIKDIYLSNFIVGIG